MAELVERALIEIGALHELCGKVLVDLQSVLRNSPPTTIWYMRDNGTFLPLPLDVEKAIVRIKDAMQAGSTGGMLCAGDGMTSQFGVVHAHDMERWPEFEARARVWLRSVLAKIKEQESE